MNYRLFLVYETRWPLNRTRDHFKPGLRPIGSFHPEKVRLLNSCFGFLGYKTIYQINYIQWHYLKYTVIISTNAFFPTQHNNCEWIIFYKICITYCMSHTSFRNGIESIQDFGFMIRPIKLYFWVWGPTVQINWWRLRS